MKNILIISYVSPYPSDSGGSSGLFHMIDGLRNKVNITLTFPFCGNESEIAPLKTIWPNVKIRAYFHTQKNGNAKFFLETKRWLKRKYFSFQQFLNFDPDLEIKHRSILFHRGFYSNPAFYSFVQEIAFNQPFDAIQVEFYQLLPVIQILPANVLKIFVHHELRFIKAKREFDLLKNKNSDYFKIIESIKQEELEYLRQYNHIITLSAIDSEILAKESADIRSFVSPLCIKNVLISQSDDFNFQYKISFIGGSAHFPNADGLNWFIQNIWPQINSKYPTIQLLISGKWEKRYILKFKKYPNIHFMGFVKDLYHEIKGSIVVIPIRIGSGMRMKIIDAVNLGLPFVTTPIGVEGLEFIHEQECLIADEPEQFTQCLLSLISNSTLQKELVKNASIKLKQKYSPELLIEKRLEVYKQIFSIQ